MTKKRKYTRLSKLNERHRAFVRHYVAGADGVRGSAGAAYSAAGWSTLRATADARGCNLLKDPLIVAEIERLTAKAEDKAVAKMVPWMELAPVAQQTLADAMTGVIPSKEAIPRITAADKVLDRAMGKPTSKVQLGGDGSSDMPTLTVRFVKASTE